MNRHLMPHYGVRPNHSAQYALAPPDRAAMRTWEFHAGAEGRSNIGMHPTLAGMDVIENLDGFGLNAGG